MWKSLNFRESSTTSLISSWNIIMDCGVITKTTIFFTICKRKFKFICKIFPFFNSFCVKVSVSGKIFTSRIWSWIINIRKHYGWKHQYTDIIIKLWCLLHLVGSLTRFFATSRAPFCTVPLHFTTLYLLWFILVHIISYSVNSTYCIKCRLLGTRCN